jgi:predicted MPP superfamily phosphohydrolase
MTYREFYLDVWGILLNRKYNNIVSPDISYKYGRKIYLLSAGHYQLIFQTQDIDKMSRHIKEKCVNYPYDKSGKYRAVDIIVSSRFMIFRKPETVVKIETLLNN